MRRNNQTALLLRRLWELFDGDLSDFHPSETPHEIKPFLKRRPGLSELQAALIAILADVETRRKTQ